jgi:hypothetical protein
MNTPRTEGMAYWADYEVVLADFARELETELAEAKARIAELEARIASVDEDGRCLECGRPREHDHVCPT